MIKGMTTDLAARFPSLGKIRKGIRTQDPKRPLIDLEYFRFTSADRPALERWWTNTFGPEPASLSVYLPYKSAAENFDAWMEEWSAGGLLHRCDGETAILHRLNDGSYSTDPIPCPYADGRERTRQTPGCQPIGRLSLIIPELIREGHVGYVTFETHSKNDIVSITASLAETERLRAGHPEGLQGIRFLLYRAPILVSTPGQDGKRVRRQKWLCRLVPEPEWVRARMAQLQAGAYTPLLDAGNPQQEEPPAEDLVNDLDAEYEVIEEETPPPPAEEEPPHLPTREELIEIIKAIAERDYAARKHTAISPAQIGLIASLIPDDKTRHTVMRTLWGVNSTKALSAAQAAALLQMICKKNGDNNSRAYSLAPGADRTIRILAQQ